MLIPPSRRRYNSSIVVSKIQVDSVEVVEIQTEMICLGIGHFCSRELQLPDKHRKKHLFASSLDRELLPALSITDIEAGWGTGILCRRQLPWTRMNSSFNGMCSFTNFVPEPAIHAVSDAPLWISWRCWQLDPPSAMVKLI